MTKFWTPNCFAQLPIGISNGETNKMPPKSWPGVNLNISVYIDIFLIRQIVTARCKTQFLVQLTLTVTYVDTITIIGLAGTPGKLTK
jgi:hypothetical protein